MNTKTLLSAIILYSVIPGYAQTINGGNGYSIMLCDSVVWTVGSNTAGQLGNGTIVDKLIPIDIGLTDVIAVQAGASHSLALKSDGTVWSWGNNNQGQLGNNSTTPSSVPIQIPGLSGIVKIVAGNSFNIALKNDSTTLMWGANFAGQINGAAPDKLFPIPAGGLGTIDIDAGEGHTMILKYDSGDVWAQGANDYGQLGYGNIGLSSSNLKQVGGIINPLINISAISAGASHSLALKIDSTILSWGRNTYGQLGDSTTTNSIDPIQVIGLNNVIAMVAGHRHSMALRSDGTVWTWGWNGFGQLGDNTLIDKLSPIQVPGLDSVIEIAAGAHHCMAKRSDSTIWVWGSNLSGQLGNNTVINTTIPVQMMLSCIPFQCPAPQIYPGNDITICNGDSVVIFGTYQQLANNYYDSLTTPNGCDSIIQIALIVDPLPTVNFTGLDSTYCVNSTIDTLTGSPSGGVFTGIIGGVFNPLVTGTFTISYSYTDGNGCTDTQSQNVTVVSCTGLGDVRFSDFKIYPNPSTGIINIQTTKPIQISNTLGQVVYNGNDNQIDLSEYGKGVYFVKVGAVIKKLVITNP